MTDTDDPMAVMSNETTMAAALRPFGWACTDDFWRRYYQDAWVFNLANAVERLTAEVERLQAKPAKITAFHARVLKWRTCLDSDGAWDLLDEALALVGVDPAATPPETGT